MSKVEYDKVIAFHPGYYIGEVIEDSGMTQVEFAKRLDITPKNLSELIHGKTSMSRKVAKNLAAMLGTSVEVWLELQKTFDAKLIEIDRLKAEETELFYLSKFRYSFFQTVGDLKPTKKKTEQLGELLSFLKVSSLKLLEDPDFIVQYRRTASNHEDAVFISNLWVQTIYTLGAKQPTEKYTKKSLTEAIDKLRSFNHRNPGDVLDEMKAILARAGVALVVIPSLSRSGIFGATKWIGRDKAIVGLTDRRKSADTFWFSLFHELAHVLEYRTKQTYVLTEDSQADEIETQADDFAKDILIPNKSYDHWIKEKVFTEDDVIAFAKASDVHPGILVGRLQKEGLIGYRHLNHLKMKFSLN